VSEPVNELLSVVGKRRHCVASRLRPSHEEPFASAWSDRSVRALPPLSAFLGVADVARANPSSIGT